jgi:hypothetical protein
MILPLFLLVTPFIKKEKLGNLTSSSLAILLTTLYLIFIHGSPMLHMAKGSISRYLFPYTIPFVVTIGFLSHTRALTTILVNGLIFWNFLTVIFFAFFRYYPKPYYLDFMVPPLSGVILGVTILIFILLLFLRRVTVLIPLTIVSLLLSIYWKNSSRNFQVRHLYPYFYYPNYWAPATEFLWEHPPTKITFFYGVNRSGSGEMPFYFLGKNFRHELVYETPNEDGSLFYPESGAKLEMDYDKWISRLRAKKIEYVIAFQNTKAELKELEGGNATKRLFGDGQNWGFYQVKSLSTASSLTPPHTLPEDSLSPTT